MDSNTTKISRYASIPGAGEEILAVLTETRKRRCEVVEILKSLDLPQKFTHLIFSSLDVSCDV